MFHLLYKIFNSFSKIERRTLGVAALVFVLAAFFIIVNLYYQKTVEKPVAGGVYTEGVLGQPTFINPLIPSTNDIDRDLIEILFSSLDDLADNYQISEDNKSWTVTLKKDLVWDDGEPITADDVVFTMETIQNPISNLPLYSTWQGVVVERLNQNEVRFTLKTPYVFLIDNFKELKIAPQHIFGGIPPTNIRLSRYNLEPVGSGPFRFERLETKRNGFIDTYQLVANDLYHDQKPYIEKLVFKFYSGEDDLIDAFNRREISAFGGLNYRYLDDLKVGYQTLTISMPRYYAIFFNPNTSLPLKEKSVRTALALATDKNKMVKKAFHDQTIIMHGPLPPNISGYDPTIYENEKFDLEAAAEILDKAGWTINDDGVRMRVIDKNSVTLKFDIVVPQINFLTEAIEVVQADWKKIGVGLNLIILNPADINNDVIRTRNYEMLLFGNILKKNPDLFSFWHSSERFYPGLNLALYSDNEADRLLEEIRQDFNGQSRDQKLSRLQQIIRDDRPAIFLFSPNYLYIAPKDLRGFRSYFVTTPANRFDNINEWHLKTARVFQ